MTLDVSAAVVVAVTVVVATAAIVAAAVAVAVVDRIDELVASFGNSLGRRTSIDLIDYLAA